MPILDFKNIPRANGSESPDTFELFARDFFSFLGYTILENPSRGADGGKDLIIQEVRTGISGNSYIKWLVSCKHYAHSEKSISPTDEINISDRIQQHKCDGFIGFYSTLASSGLMDRLTSLQSNFLCQVFDSSMIEGKLIGNLEGELLAKRYFQKSISSYLINNPRPVQLFDEIPTLHCEVCKKELINNELVRKSIIVFYYEYISEPFHKSYVKITTCCKGKCDRILSEQVDFLSGWEDLSDLKSPLIYLRHIISFINELNSPHTSYSKEALESLKTIFIRLFPFVCRELSYHDKELINDLYKIPSALGGLG